MVASEVDGSPSQPALKALAQVDMHRLLRDPDGFPELMSELDFAEASQIVDYLAVQLSSATEIDATGIIEQLALFCADDDRHEQSSMRCLSRSVATFVADCVQFVADDDAEFIVIEFVSTVPLVYGFDFLCKAGAAHGLVRARLGHEHSSSGTYVTDVKSIEHAIEIWRQRARRVIASGYVTEEGHLFLLFGRSGAFRR